MDCGCRVLTRFSYRSCWAVFSARRFTLSGTKNRSFTLHWYYVWVEIIQHPNYMLSKITSILIIASWMHNTAAWGFVFPGMSAIRHQSLVCQGCGSPVDKEEAQSTLGRLSARILFRHNPVFYVTQQISERLCRKRSGLRTISAVLVESKALHPSHRGCSVQHSLPLLTRPTNAKGRFRGTDSIVEVKKILHLL